MYRSTEDIVQRVRADWELEWLPALYQHPLDAIDRLGREWTEACIRIHRGKLYLTEDETA